MDKKLTIKTDAGFECEVSEYALNDMRVLDALVDLNRGDNVDKMAAIKELIDRLLGKEQKEKLYSFIEERKGYADLSETTKAISEIISKINDAKKN